MCEACKNREQRIAILEAALRKIARNGGPAWRIIAERALRGEETQ